ncbi:metal ABC transporter substrate-binding protein [Halomonas eurihalina]|uniref:Metal ABC transporter substrate-binding protein n=1 Tax=Halomonas eurihalina TaxID=42566 RepID=A0A5D9DC81_HALER|nr:zinc ABC transporter substrate-binding protein [Halomonas eurihalina]MDR5860213.1 zinc ABC transporter substrate-binding protein [Halomonas eurihalina]TZG40361.1 metal ABC transporter substrate-binding protein [Halomonas eurihalina]
MPFTIPFKRHAALIAGLSALLATPSVLAEERVQVIASFSILADMVEQVGGEYVEVDALVGPDGDAHVYSPRPDDARNLAHADLVVFNGMHFEGWMERLLNAGDYEGPKVVATAGIATQEEGEDSQSHDHSGHDHAEHDHGGHDHGHDHSGHDHAEHDHGGHGHGHDHSGHDHGGQDPHAWLDPMLGKRYVANIRDGLIAADPAHEEEYRQRAQAYMADLDALDAEIHEQMAALPESTSVITGHDSFGYFSKAYGVSFLSPAGLTTATEPSAAHMAELIDVIEANNVQALFHENMTSPAIIDQLAEETGRPVAGTLYSGALSPEGEASTYIGMMRHNARVLHDALADPEAKGASEPESQHEH